MNAIVNGDFAIGDRRDLGPDSSLFGEALGMDVRELTTQVEHISQAYASRFGITRDV